MRRGARPRERRALCDAGKLAELKTKSKDLKAFAQQMVTDHSGVNKAATDLVKKLNVTPEDNPTAQSLKQGADSEFHTAMLSPEAGVNSTLVLSCIEQNGPGH
ncbi:hypothetical protein AWB75_03008 [Caballeronia catudaia]|uniref:DUF4142 domain-containing protein n=1 Tax=Caballeronia catudaia TaxID=1777136 RepID=A0A158B5D1_9BURK|nr:hypothetical protein AWB75_03008 [Caballeronia catudaia]